MARLFQVLKGIYYGTTPGALRGPQALFEQAKKAKVKNVTLKACKDFLATQPIYTRNRPARKSYKRNKIDANYPGHVVQIDILDLVNFKDSNPYRYVLLSYDTFSKYLVGLPLSSRKVEPIQEALETMIETSPFPWRAIFWDRESSFVSKYVQNFLTARKIHNYFTTAKTKAAGVERSIRTLRNLLQRRLEASKSTYWERELPKIIANFNKRKHSVTKIPPNDLARNPTLLVIPPESKPANQIKVPPVGSHVRLNRLRGIFEKEASSSWTEEVFIVTRLNTTGSIPLIYVKDLKGDPILGGLYPEEVQQVSWDGKRLVDKVLKQRKLPGKPREYLVSYRGWPVKFNEWLAKVPL